jgi:type IV pilus assembly protein PilZ
MDAEKRRSDRAPVSIRVDYSTVDELFWDFARNINEGGIFVETGSPPPLGTTVRLKFYIPNRDEPIESMGEVVRVETEAGAKGSRPGMGIEFRGLDRQAKEAINSLVRELRKG